MLSPCHYSGRLMHEVQNVQCSNQIKWWRGVGKDLFSRPRPLPCCDGTRCACASCVRVWAVFMPRHSPTVYPLIAVCLCHVRQRTRRHRWHLMKSNRLIDASTSNIRARYIRLQTYRQSDVSIFNRPVDLVVSKTLSYAGYWRKADK